MKVKKKKNRNYTYIMKYPTALVFLNAPDPIYVRNKAATCGAVCS